jgi:hypothetical protein
MDSFRQMLARRRPIIKAALKVKIEKSQGFLSFGRKKKPRFSFFWQKKKVKVFCLLAEKKSQDFLSSGRKKKSRDFFFVCSLFF